MKILFNPATKYFIVGVAHDELKIGSLHKIVMILRYSTYLIVFIC